MQALLFVLAAVSGDLSHESIHEARREKPWVRHQSRLHLVHKSEDDLVEDARVLWGYEMAAFAQYDAAAEPDDRAELKVENFLARAYREQWNGRIGWQTVSWGETLGPSLIDVINPRDLRDPGYWLRADRKLAVPLLLAGWSGDSLAVDAWLSPGAPQSLLPKTWQGMRLENHDKTNLAEYGLRAGGRMAGWDMKVYAIRHRSRVPNLRLRASELEPGILASFPLQTSLGLTLSQAWDNVVLRSELVHAASREQPADNLVESARDQAVIGLDASWGAHFFWASELRYSRQTSPDPDQDQVAWVIAQGRWTFFDERLRPLIYVMQRLEEHDVYRRYELGGSLNPSWDLGVSWEDFQSRQGGYFKRFMAEDRLGLRLRWEF